jgi:hypothetical protein
MLIMMSCVLRMKGKMNKCKRRMFVSNIRGYVLKADNVSTQSKSPRLCKRTSIATIIFATNQ